MARNRRLRRDATTRRRPSPAIRSRSRGAHPARAPETCCGHFEPTALATTKTLRPCQRNSQCALLNADMRLGAAHHHLTALFDRRPDQTPVGDAGEMKLFRPDWASLVGCAAIASVRPRSCGQLLLTTVGTPKTFHTPTSHTQLARNSVTAVNGRQQARLHIHDQQCGFRDASACSSSSVSLAAAAAGLVRPPQGGQFIAGPGTARVRGSQRLDVPHRTPSARGCGPPVRRSCRFGARDIRDRESSPAHGAGGVVTNGLLDPRHQASSSIPRHRRRTNRTTRTSLSQSWPITSDSGPLHAAFPPGGNLRGADAHAAGLSVASERP